MKCSFQKTPALVVALVLAVFYGSSALHSATEDGAKQQMTAAVEAVRPALIRIHIVAADYRQGRELKMESFGSGVIISPDGYAVTNHHVAEDAEHIVCTLADRREVDAKLIGTDPMSDIAVIKLAPPDGKPFPFAEFGDSSKIEVGDTVFAMGCPYALSQSVTMGMVSNAEMIMPGDTGGEEGLTLEGEDVGSIVRWIGHDALIRPGNSGGPLVDTTGKIIGINEISYGLSGAIPSNLARQIVDQLIRNGKVTRSWLGIEVQPLLESSKLDRGILVSGTIEGGPAQKAGLKSGDVILALAGQDVVARFKEEVPIFNQFAAALSIGRPVEVRALRDGSETTLTLTPEERPRAMEKQHELKAWGMCASNIAYLDQKEMELDSQDGVIVTGILPSGPAGSAKPQLQEGDVITAVGPEAVKDISALRAITKSLTEGKDEQVPTVVQFTRGQRRFATLVKIGKEERTKPGTEISKAWLPIDIQVLTRELAEGLGVPKKTGVRVTRVYSDSSAAKAGLKVGDLILKLDGEEIPAEQEGDEEVLPSMIRQYDIGSKVKLGIVRDGKPVNVQVVLEAAPKPSREFPTYTDDNFEFTARDIAFSDRADGTVTKGQTGVYVESVSDGSWAAIGGLRAGDTIVEIDGQSVNKLVDLERLMTGISQTKAKTVVLKLRRGIHTVYAELEPSWQE